MWIYPLIAVLVTGSIFGAIALMLFGRPQLLESVFGPAKIAPVEFETLAKTDRPNQYLVCPENLCNQEPDAVAPVFDMPAGDLDARWQRMIAARPRVMPLTFSDNPPAELRQYDFVQRSRLFAFPDIITVRFFDLNDDRSTLAIFSRSVYGRSDLGVNRRRVKAWLSLLTEQR